MMAASITRKRLISQVLSCRGLHGSVSAQAYTKFTMPAMSPTMTEGGVTAWKKKEGEKYAAGDVLLELETDKATMDVEAQDDGVMVKILVQDGAKGVPVGQVIAITGEEGDATSGSEVDAIIKESESASAKPKEAEKEPVKPKESEAPQAKADSKAAAPASTEAPASSDKPREFIFASPIAKRLALERGIALKDIKGTGPNGRIIKSDVENYKAAAPAAAASAPAPAAEAFYVDLPLTSMRKVIAQRLSESKQTVPHYYVTAELNVDRLLKLRQVFNNAAKIAADAGEKGTKTSAKLSVNDFIIKAVAAACQEVPEANSAWIGNGVIRQYKKVDVSVAVATPTGLITPIVANADARGLASISYTMKELAKKARDGKLKPDEYQGGTFTISNLGMFGSVSEFSAIINPPQSCILAIGGTEDKLVLDEESEKGFKSTKTIKVTLSADHRVVDGAVGARWMKAFKDVMENPLALLL